jgi:hypothetical protein
MALLASVPGGAPGRARLVALGAFTCGRWRGRAYRNGQEQQQGDWACEHPHLSVAMIIEQAWPADAQIPRR